MGSVHRHVDGGPCKAATWDEAELFSKGDGRMNGKRPGMGEVWRRVAEGSRLAPPGTLVTVAYVSTPGRYRTVEFVCNGERYQSPVTRFMKRFRRVDDPKQAEGARGC